APEVGERADRHRTLDVEQGRGVAEFELLQADADELPRGWTGGLGRAEPARRGAGGTSHVALTNMDDGSESQHAPRGVGRGSGEFGNGGGVRVWAERPAPTEKVPSSPGPVNRSATIWG